MRLKEIMLKNEEIKFETDYQDFLFLSEEEFNKINKLGDTCENSTTLISIELHPWGGNKGVSSTDKITTDY